MLLYSWFKMWSHRAFFLVLFLSLPSLYYAQSDVSTPGLIAIFSIGGGTVIIICLIWLVICCNLYKTERDFCKFKKYLRLDRYQQQQERRRQRDMNRSIQMQRLSPTHQTANPPATSNVLPSAPPHPMEQTNTPLQPACTSIARSNIAETTMTNEQQTPSTMSSNRGGIVRSNTDQQLNRSALHNGSNHKTKSVRFTKSSSTSKIESQKKHSNNNVQLMRQPEAQHSTAKHHDTTGFENRSDQQQELRSSGVQRVVLGHYSPTLLREHEEIDVTVDTNASPPRYSWLFSDKTRQSARSGGRKGGAYDAMRAYGQLTTWPQKL